MVTVLLSGGLGNQMFQYAAAKALAHRLNTSVAIDLYTLNKKTQATTRSFELDIFNIDIQERSNIKDKLITKFRPYIQKYRGFFQRFGILTDIYAILYQPAFETISGKNIIMSGYFQNERYFRDIENTIREEFTFGKPFTSQNQTLANEISKGQSVAVHIRRGDYLTNKSAVSNFVTCDKSYYEKAISHIIENVENPEFYIFSEDFEWIEKNLNFREYPVHYIDWNRGQESYIDMQLMSLCKHNIIANSSFSWWAAWLNNNNKKVVVAPSLWFQDNTKNKLLDQFYPKGWIKL
ncbi:MAG: alpha-1,2-fucosyltransferase [Dysgonomonas sp.]|nr:alpha-1,2-fucosyltransferase [Dysgonomonas sp.]